MLSFVQIMFWGASVISSKRQLNHILYTLELPGLLDRNHVDLIQVLNLLSYEVIG